MIGAVVLAAGAGARLGGVAKALCQLDGGETFLAAIARTARAAGVEAIVVVAGPPHGEPIRAAARALGLAIAWNDDPARGMASSIARGFAALVEDRALDAGLLWPVDHPRIAAHVIAQLCAARGDADAAIPTFAERGGHPALVGRALWPALIAGDHPDGARGVLRAARTVRVAVDDPGVRRDVDTPEALAAMHATGPE
ncbi:MAG: NTP transferase domain-containing protein [Deltaproteobacteria bacterium]|nr:NTP transferase domain-containing protein [Deltaproteobacteria bacterium]